MFSSGSCSSISFATVTPSLVMIGAPNFFSITALRPLGPSVILTASARMLTPRRMAWREFSPVTICFAINLFPPRDSSHWLPGPERQGVRKLLLAAGSLRCVADLGEDLVFLENHEFLVVNRDLVAAVLAEQDSVPGFHVERNQLALFPAPISHGDNFAFLRFFFCRVRNDDAALH